jgi:hypothetical protein
MRSSIVFPVLLALAAALSACGSSHSSPSSAKPVNPNTKEKSPPGDIPDNQVYVAYTVPGKAVSVKVPEGWARSNAGGAIVFTDKLNTVRIETRTATGGTPSTKGLHASSVRKVARARGTAIRIKYTAGGPANPVTGKRVKDAFERYVYVHGSKELVLTLSGPVRADNVDPWRLISNSVRWK